MRLKTTIGIVLTLYLFSMSTLAFNIQPVKSSSSWWDSAWMYRRQVAITERSGYPITSFPIEVNFQHDGKAQPDGDDIRVVADSVEIPSYVTSIDNTYAKVIFEINLAALETKNVYVYYGNPSTTLPTYPLVPLTISEGNTGHAVIDNSVYIGWDYTSWGWSNNVELWNDFRIDFNGNNNPTDDNDLIRDYGSRQGGIGRHRRDIQAIGLGNYQGYVQTPIYVDIKFADARLRIYRNNPWVETTQADFLFMFSPSWDYASYGGGIEQNIVDGLNTNYPELWNELYFSKANPRWIAFRDSPTGNVFASSGLRIGADYSYYQSAKEMTDWDRVIFYFSGHDRDFPLGPYDQPPDCRIYWYGDNTNGYSSIDKTANILNNQPSTTVGEEETGIISKQLAIKLSGSFDYSAKENVKIRLGAMVKDANSLELVSDANATIRIYFPNSTLWVSGKMMERQTEKGFYDWESSKTIYQMKLPDGVYSVYANASINNGPVASDFLLFHIDPPIEETTSLAPLLYYAITIIVLVLGTTIGVALLRRHRKLQVTQ